MLQVSTVNHETRGNNQFLRRSILLRMSLYSLTLLCTFLLYWQRVATFCENESRNVYCKYYFQGYRISSFVRMSSFSVQFTYFDFEKGGCLQQNSLLAIPYIHITGVSLKQMFQYCLSLLWNYAQEFYMMPRNHKHCCCRMHN